MTSALFDRFERVLSCWGGTKAPGLVVAIRLADGRVWQGAAGLASLGTAHALTSQSRIRIGSITKQFVAAVGFILAEEGRLDLDSDAIVYLPRLPRIYAGLPLRRLFNHTSGLWDHVSAHVIANGALPALMSDEEMLSTAIAQQHLNFSPGTDVTYSNSAYLILGRVIEAVEGEPLNEVLQRRLLRPLGMNDTAMVRSDMQIEPALADLHVPLPTGRFLRGLFPLPLGAEGGMVSTSSDLLRWLRHWESPTAFSASVWKAMNSLVVFPNGRLSPFRNGLMYQHWRGLELIHHDGGVFGGVARVMQVPALGLDLVILANRGDVSLDRVSRAIILAAADGELPEPELAAPEPIVGNYYASVTDRVYRFSETEEGAVVEIPGTPTARLRRESDGRLSGDSAETRHLRFRPSEAGREPPSIQIEAAQSAVVFERLPSCEGSSNVPQGRYTVPALRAEALLKTTPDGAQLSFFGRTGVNHHRLTALAPDVWEGQSLLGAPFKFVLKLESSSQGPTLILSSQRLRHIRLEPIST